MGRTPGQVRHDFAEQIVVNRLRIDVIDIELAQLALQATLTVGLAGRVFTIGEAVGVPNQHVANREIALCKPSHHGVAGAKRIAARDDRR